MPRTENPLDPLAGPVAAFAHDLRILREKAGSPPYRTLSKRAGFAASTLSVAASGMAIPSLDVTLAYVQACGGDPGPWRERWQTLATQPLTTPAEKTPEPSATAQSTPPAPTTPPAPANPSKRRRHSIVRRSLVMVTTTVLLVFGVLAGAISSPHMPCTPQLAAEHLQLSNVYAVICQGQPATATAGASLGPVSTRDEYGERDVLIADMLERHKQAMQISQLDVSLIPDGSRLQQALYEYLIDTADADSMYAISANEGKSPNSASGVSDTAYAAAQEMESKAQQARSVALDLWNSHAQALGMPQITNHMI